MKCLFSLLLLLCAAPALHAAGEPDIPPALQEWSGWVLHGIEDYDCPHGYQADKPRFCAWPGRLDLNISDREGRFVQEWQAYAQSWIPLPGSSRHWPQEARLDGKPVAVIARQGQPVIRVEPGRHRISGHLLWNRIPERLAIPPSLGLIDLRIAGEEVAFPDFSHRGQLWLRQKQGEAQQDQGDRLSLQVFRLIEDDLPQGLVTRIDIEVSGKAREILLPDVLLPGFTASSLDSALPARLEQDGALRLQIRPGRWSLNLSARSDSDLNPITLQKHPAPWPDNEIWAFNAHNELRQVEVIGLTRIDPRQTRLPSEWGQLPAFKVQPGETLGFRILRRGDQTPYEDQLALNRLLWLDFDGQGYTLQDRLTGDIHKSWRLSTEADLLLGQVKIDNQAQFITHLPDDKRRGVEIRRGKLDMQADSRYEQGIRDIPANGWNQDLQSVQATLQLPPGWRLFSVSGIDNAPNTWLQRWSLLDIFLVLIAAIATARLFGLAWGGVMLAVLALSWHEPWAPQYSWLNLLVAVALLRLLPEGRMRHLLNLYRGLALVILILIAIPFIIQEVRTGIYPQLEQPVTGYSMTPSSAVVASAPRQMAEEEIMLADSAVALEAKSKLKPDYARSYPSRSRSLDEIDPNAQLQTGPGLPDWNWVQIPLRWNGPVEMGQRMRLTLVPPWAVMLIKILLSALLILIVIRLAEFRRLHIKLPSSGVAVLLLSLIALPSLSPEALAADYPGEPLLKELRQRLLEPEDCLPSCAQVPHADLEVSGQTLTLDLELHNEQGVAIPLPGSPRGWMPTRIQLDERPAGLMYRDDKDILWLSVPAGVHQLRLSGPLPDRDRLQLHFPLKPHHLSVLAQGWKILGMLDDGGMEPNLELVRQQASAGQARTLQPIPLPGFARLERTLHLGLDWHVDNRMTRITASDKALLLSIPLLTGEAVTTPGVQVRDGHVQVNLAPGQRQISWSSRLPKTEQILLKAPVSLQAGQASWVETWELDVSPIWHVQIDGIPVIHQSDPTGRWLPQWRPWPGEEVRLDITRPQGVEGQTLTIDASTLTIKPGKRATDNTLDLTLRSTQGGQHTLTLPKDVALQKVSINGLTQNLGVDQGKLVLPIQPGNHSLSLIWRSPQGQELLLRTPGIDLGAASVNHRITLQQGHDRWILFTGGPLLGPAVLFWGVILVLLVISIGLSISQMTPLKAWQWFLLSLGLTQTPVWLGLVVVGWLLLLGARGRLQRTIDPGIHNAMQLGLALLSLVAMGALFVAVQQGLLGQPDMQIAGNNSSAGNLHWYQDRSDEVPPQAWTLSLPLLAYRLLMLAWALWLAFALLGWLRWGWMSLNVGGLWLTIPPKPRKARKTRKGTGPDAPQEQPPRSE